MANEPENLNEENLYVLHCGAEYNVAVGLSRLGAFPVYVQGWALTRLGKNSDGLRKKRHFHRFGDTGGRELTGFMKSSTDRETPKRSIIGKIRGLPDRSP